MRTNVIYIHHANTDFVWTQMAHTFVIVTTDGKGKIARKVRFYSIYYIVSSMASNILFKSSVLLLRLMLIYFVKMPMNASSSVYVKMEEVVWTLMDHTHAGVRKAGKDNIANLVCLFIFLKIYQWIK